MGANIAGIYGAQIFREEDKPFYRRGFTINIAVLASGLALGITRYAYDVVRQRRNPRQQDQPLQGETVDVSKGGNIDEKAGGGSSLSVKQEPL